MDNRKRNGEAGFRKEEHEGALECKLDGNKCEGRESGKARLREYEKEI